ncbi:MAG: FAD-dependent oxidoreductase [bacterium]
MRKILNTAMLLFIITIMLAGRGGAKAEAKQSRDLRIAIIGAGASGLTAAYYLKNAGYENITVYEKEPRVGGKVYSYTYDDHTFELGALWVEEYYRIVYGLAFKYGIDLQPEEADIVIRDSNNTNYASPLAYVSARYDSSEIESAYINYEKVQLKFKSLNKPGFEGADPELFMTFDKFAEKYQIEPIAYGFATFWTNAGYGYYHEVPALYVLKLMLPNLKGPGPYVDTLGRAPDGLQRLWEKVAADLEDVRLNHTVEKVKRNDSGNSASIEVTANGLTETFDRIIISSDLKESLNFIDASEEEQELFSQVQSNNYNVHIVRADGIPYQVGTMVLLAKNTVPESIGHIMAIVGRETSPGVWTSYQLAPWGTSSDDIANLLQEDVKQLGGHVESIIIQKRWSYFPHVKSQSLYDGFYDRMEALQGKNGTYYIGGIMNFEAVENTCEYAEKIVATYFLR